jgi:DNA-binding Lrp family transcriptional regulator
MTESLDEQLIELLSQDARQSSQALAKQLNVSSSTVRRRISKLVKRGALRFAALAEPAEFGFYLRAIIAFDVEHGKVRGVMELLSGRSEVKGLATTSGRFDLITWQSQ